MAQMFSASIDSSSVLGMFDRLAQSTDFVLREVGRETATRIVAEAKGRVQRASGKTGEGIHWELTRDGKGYIVLAYQAKAQEDPVDIYLEYGTRYTYAKPFFFAAGLLEEGPHMRRLIDRMQEWLDEVGR